MISVEQIEFQCQGPVQRPKHARVGKCARTPGGQMVGEGVPTVILMIFLFYFVSRTSRSRDTGVCRRSE